MDLQTGISGLALVVAFIAIIRVEVHQRRRGPEEIQRNAVERIDKALGSAYSIIEHADVIYPTRDQVCDVMLEFEREWQRLDHRLPRGARHLGQSTREAMANCFGPPAAIGIDPTARQTALRPFDPKWWDIGSTYLEYAQARLGLWLVNERRQPLDLVPYYQWRREEDQRQGGSEVHRRI